MVYIFFTTNIKFKSKSSPLVENNYILKSLVLSICNWFIGRRKIKRKLKILAQFDFLIDFVVLCSKPTVDKSSRYESSFEWSIMFHRDKEMGPFKCLCSKWSCSWHETGGGSVCLYLEYLKYAFPFLFNNQHSNIYPKSLHL